MNNPALNLLSHNLPTVINILKLNRQHH